jgi:hypothetical protein
MNDPAFRAKVAKVQVRMSERAVSRLAASLTHASTTLRQLLGATSESVRLGAARSIVEMHARMRENIELAARVEQMELAMAEHRARIEELAQQRFKSCPA